MSYHPATNQRFRLPWKEAFGGLGGLVFALCLALLAIGLLFIYSTSYVPRKGFLASYAAKQMLWSVVGVTAFLFVLCIDYRTWLKNAMAFYWLGVILLIVTAFIGVKRGGARCWIELGPVLFQTSEIIKLALIVILAQILTAQQTTHPVVNMLIPYGVMLLPTLLLLNQPDLGTAMLLVPVVSVMVFVAGVDMKYLISLGLWGVVLGCLLFHFGLHDYQQKRVRMFINQNQMTLEEKRGSGYHLVQSKITLGNGGFWGKGLRRGTQNRYNFLPERHTDFIFSVIGEEWGYVGTGLVLSIYTAFFFSMLLIAYTTTDPPAQLLVVGVMTLLCMQTLINTCMTVGLAPITGLPLPFVSYGGSSLVFNFIGLALVVSVNARKGTV